MDAGRICGIIATVLLILGVLFLIFWLMMLLGIFSLAIGASRA